MRDRLYLDMMQSVLGSSSKVLVDQKAGNNLMYLPLDKLMRSGEAASSPQPAADVGKAGTPEALSMEPPRTRDALRSREGR
jgi:membrane protease subunit HflK